MANTNLGPGLNGSEAFQVYGSGQLISTNQIASFANSSSVSVPLSAGSQAAAGSNPLQYISCRHRISFFQTPAPARYGGFHPSDMTTLP